MTINHNFIYDFSNLYCYYGNPDWKNPLAAVGFTVRHLIFGVVNFVWKNGTRDFFPLYFPKS